MAFAPRQATLHPSATSIDALYIVRRSELPSDLRDLDRVTLTAAEVTDDGFTMVVGTEGTIVDIRRDGVAFEVEFAEPVSALATVAAADLRPVKRAVA